MRGLTCLIISNVLLVGCSFSHQTAAIPAAKTVVSLVTGTVELPKGFTYTPGAGDDTFVGKFTSADGNLIIEYDIGSLAGVYADHVEEAGGKVISSTNATANGLKAKIVVAHSGGRTSAYVSFPDGGPANFFATIRSDADFNKVKELALSFRMKPRPKEK
jgi:hypothetical protein